MHRQIGLMVVFAGAILIGLGILIYSGGLRWFGKLPGDIRFRMITYSSMHDRFDADHVAGAEFAVLFTPPILLSQHQPVGFVSLQSQLARGFLQRRLFIEAFVSQRAHAFRQGL